MRGVSPGRPLLSSHGWRLGLIGALYAWQGLVAGFAMTAVPNHFAALGASAAEVGAHLATVGLPWIVQPLWGPVVDRFGGMAMGRRRFWVVLAFLGSLLCLLRLLLVEDGAAGVLPAISAVFLVQGAFAALADTATDAMVIDRVPADRLGAASAATRIGFVGGGAAGAVLFTWLLAEHGPRGATLVLLALGAAILLLPILVREREGDPLVSARALPRSAVRAAPSATLREVAMLFASRSTLALLAFCFALDAAAAAFAVPLGVDLIQSRGWTAEALSGVQAGAGMVAGTLGAVLVGWWTDRAGVRRSLAILLGFCAAAHAGAGWLLGAEAPGLTRIAAPAALVLSVTLPALVFVALAPGVMRRSVGPLAATRFALFMAALNMGSVAGAAASATIVSAIGLAATGVATGVVFGLAALCAAATPEEAPVQER
jgi:PAT family beta-lactamase induction signal transducer AmpG